MDERQRAVNIVELLKKQYPNARYYLNFSNPLQLLVAAILSAQCRDSLVNSVTGGLFKDYKTPEEFTQLDETEIKDITFFRNKARYIRETAKKLIENHNGKVPETMEELTKLPGVGRKTANAILINAFGKTLGIVVDVHVIRLSYRLGFTKNKDPKKIEKDLMALLPKENWNRFTWLMKDHGRAVCRAPVPYCSKCILLELCPKQGVTKRS